MSKENQNYFDKLNSINVSDKIEKKNGLSYLSWAYAWAEAKKNFPNANYIIYETPEGRIYWHDNKTAWVKTGVIIEGVEHIEYLPIIDYKYKSIPLNNITSFEVNKTIQRSLTKALARHGLGLYVYAGEDLPDKERDLICENNDVTLTDSQVSYIQGLLDNTDKTARDICDAYKVSHLHELKFSSYESIVTRLTALSQKFNLNQEV